MDPMTLNEFRAWFEDFCRGCEDELDVQNADVIRKKLAGVVPFFASGPEEIKPIDLE